ncbi:MAG: PQQ-binding-like beta-propeller repeat protein [Akkermansiaceae bacterium]|nr:PQQ-binding-like beta-propeller repeat protein [Akkermansiaceae bacterium]
MKWTRKRKRWAVAILAAGLAAGGIVGDRLVGNRIVPDGPPLSAMLWREWIARPDLSTIKPVENCTEADAWGLSGTVEMPPENELAGWSFSAGDRNGSRYFASTRITPENVRDLEPAWVFRYGRSRPGNTVQATPVFHQGLLYTVDLDGAVIALDAASGTEKWRHDLPAPAGRRGLTLARVGDETYLFVPHFRGVQAFRASDGAAAPFGGRGKSGLRGKYDYKISKLPPIVVGDRLYVAFNRGEVAAFDIQSGAVEWRTRFKAGEPSPRTWSGFTYDPQTDRLIAITGNLSDDVHGVDGRGRKMRHDFGCSMLALDARDGSILWQSQDVVDDVWDLDMIGKPVLATLRDGEMARRVVFGFGKSGNVHAVDVETGRYLRPDAVQFALPAGAQWSPDGKAAAQPVFSWPEPVSGVRYDLDSDLPKEPSNREYMAHRMRYAKTDLLTRPSIEHDSVVKGLHGGPEWMGGAIDYTTGSLIIPINNCPWILRVEYDDPVFKKIAKRFEHLTGRDPVHQRWSDNTYTYFEEVTEAYLKATKFPVDPEYVRACSSCHGVGRQGSFGSEFSPGGFQPGLVGFFDKTRNKGVKLTPEYYRDVHRYVEGEFDETAEALAKIEAYMRAHDDHIKEKDGYALDGFWQVLRDANGSLATDEPWGFLVSLNLITGRINWRRPFGQSPGHEGSLNFGGVMTTASGLTFATGTTDEKAYAFRSATGEEVWSEKLPHAGSAPPMGFELDGATYVVFTATGGRFHEYDQDNQGDALVAYRLKNAESPE